MSRVVDASVVVAALLDDGPDGHSCETILAGGRLVAPHIMPFEVANVVRRIAGRGEIDRSIGSVAIDDLVRLAVDLVPFELVAARTWELRATLTSYDASYVAVAELLDAPLYTLDARLGRASGPRCEINVVDPGPS